MHASVEESGNVFLEEKVNHFWDEYPQAQLAFNKASDALIELYKILGTLDFKAP